MRIDQTDNTSLLWSECTAGERLMVLRTATLDEDPEEACARREGETGESGEDDETLVARTLLRRLLVLVQAGRITVDEAYTRLTNHRLSSIPGVVRGRNGRYFIQT